jgi:hypothetical protein
MTTKPKICPECGAKMVTYTQHLNLALKHNLVQIHAVGGGPIRINDLSLTHNQWSNFPKLAYWGLAENTAAGIWALTELGRLFICGGISIPRSTTTYRGVVVRQFGKDIYFKDITGRCKRRYEYAKDAQPLPAE